MQLDTISNEVTRIGSTSKKEFSVKVGSHIMAILSGLYKEPASAMVREYLTNMRDAYVPIFLENPNAQTIPAQLHVPTNLSPTLIFKDFGVGMDFNTVWNIFSTYGESTKNNNNLQTGGLGIGSKTAFCYNDGANWSIESRYNGEIHIFVSNLNENGIPELNHICSEPTTEPNGVTIKIPIRKEDIEKVKKAVLTYVPYYPYKIEVIGMTMPLVPEHTFKTSHSKLSLGKDSYYEDRGITVIMGDVPYFVPYDIISSIMNKVCIESAEMLRFCKIELYLNIGSCDIVPSRDSLKITPKTELSLKKGVEAFIKDLENWIVTNAKFTTKWDALEWYHSVKSMRIPQQLVGKIKINRQYIGETYIVIDPKELLRSNIKFTPYSSKGIYRNGRYTHTLSTDPYYMDAKASLSPVNSCSVILSDIDDTINADKLLRKLVREQILRVSGYVFLFEGIKTISDLSELLEGYPAKNIISLKEFESKLPVKTRTVIKDASAYVWNGSWSTRSSLTAINTTNRKFYIEFIKVGNKWAPQYKINGHKHTEALAILDSCLTRLDKMDDIKNQPYTFFGVKTTDIPTLDSSWTNIFDYISSAATRHKDLLHKCASWETHKSKLQSKISNSIVNFISQHFNSFNYILEISDFQNKLLNYKKEEAKLEDIITNKLYGIDSIVNGLVRFFNHDSLANQWKSSSNSSFSDLFAAYDKIIAKFPLLYIIVTPTIPYKSVVDYIVALDAYLTKSNI